MSKSLKLTCFNIDTNIGQLEGSPLRDVFPKWRINYRMKFILHHLLKSDADIICLQELRDFINFNGERINSVAPIKETLEQNGYDCIIMSYNETGGDKAFKYLTAYRRDSIESESAEMVYFTKSGKCLDREGRTDEELKDHNYGDLFERGVMITKLKVAGRRIAVINAHFGISWNVRKNSSIIINRTFNELTEEGIDTVCVGDFNSFPDWNGGEQCEIIKGGGRDCLNALEHYENSFVGFPYDFGKMAATFKKEGIFDRLDAIKDNEEKYAAYIEVYKTRYEAMTGRLDNVFYKGFKSVSAEIVLTPCKGDDNVEFSQAAVKEYVLKCAEVKEPAFASDHQMIIVNMELL